MRSLAAGLLVASLCLAVSGCRSTGHHPLPPVASCDCQALFEPQRTCPQPIVPPAPADAGPVALDRKPVHLVFEGGGVKGVAYVGALQVLGENDLLEDVTSVAGTSAGSITALAVALGFTPDEITTLILNLDFEKFEDGTFLTDAARLFEDFGWFDGRYAECVFECMANRKLGKPDATFLDLHARVGAEPGFRDLYVVATDLDERDWVVMSHESERFASLPLARAARASMSIPFFFTAQEIEGQTFVDGGVLRNYPIDVFDGPIEVFDSSPNADPGAPTLGFFLGSLTGGEPSTDLLVFSEQVLETLLDQQVLELCQDPGQEANRLRTAFLNPLNIGTTDFGISDADKCRLIRSGAEGTRAYLAAPSASCPERLIDAIEARRLSRGR
jgi:NTE family protein